MLNPSLIRPWFLVLSMGIGTMGTWSALGMRRDPGHANRRASWSMAAIAWTPVLFWILAQFFAER